MIAASRTVTEIAAIGNGWTGRMELLRPWNVLELGTGQGASGAQIMGALLPDAQFTTINYADGHHFGEQLGCWESDPRLHMLAADTIDPATVNLFPDGVDLLFIDTTHEAWHAATELRLWQDKLEDGAIVVVDDLDQHDMVDFWYSLPYEKVPTNGTEPRQGLFRYNAAHRYVATFARPERTTYGGKK